MIQSQEDVQKLRISGRLAASVLEMIEPFIIPGVSTAYLERICRNYIINDLKAIPSSLGYLGFPACMCTCINNVVCHGIPSEQDILKEGDILNIDLTVSKDGFIADTSKMFYVGYVKPIARKLVETTKNVLYTAIKIIRPGIRIGDIGFMIENYAYRHGYSVVHEFSGHGIGRTIWEEPSIPNFGELNTGLTIKSGMVFTLEPRLNIGKRDVITLADGWTTVTKDGNLSAQCEHTVLVTDTGFEILTLRKEEEETFSNPVQRQALT